MEKKENRYSLFEEELRKKIDDSKVNYKAIESILFSRISDVEQFRELAILKLDEMPTAERLDQVEHKLFSQITQYNEYEVPINECISTEYDLSASQWDRLTRKLKSGFAVVHRSRMGTNFNGFRKRTSSRSVGKN